MTEEQRKKQEADKAAYQAAVQAEMARRQQIVTDVAATAAGKKLLRMLHDICGFTQADRVVRADGQVDTLATCLNSERRNVYLNLRGFMTPEVRREVENGEQTEAK